jgi:hypothetical protein
MASHADGAVTVRLYGGSATEAELVARYQPNTIALLPIRRTWQTSRGRQRYRGWKGAIEVLLKAKFGRRCFRETSSPAVFGEALHPCSGCTAVRLKWQGLRVGVNSNSGSRLAVGAGPANYPRENRSTTSHIRSTPRCRAARAFRACRSWLPVKHAIAAKELAGGIAQHVAQNYDPWGHRLAIEAGSVALATARS